MNGVEMIAEARRLQVEKHRYDATHDDQHAAGELVRCAITILYAPYAKAGDDWWVREADRIVAHHTPIEQLAIVGALIAAEIDREARVAAKGQVAQ